MSSKWDCWNECLHISGLVEQQIITLKWKYRCREMKGGVVQLAVKKRRGHLIWIIKKKNKAHRFRRWLYLTFFHNNNNKTIWRLCYSMLRFSASTPGHVLSVPGHRFEDKYLAAPTWPLRQIGARQPGRVKRPLASLHPPCSRLAWRPPQPALRRWPLIPPGRRIRDRGGGGGAGARVCTEIQEGNKGIT